MSKVWIEKHGDRLRLVWNDQGKRQTLSVGVDDNATRRAIAHKKAREIELDLLTGHYDPTKLKYKPRRLGKNKSEVTVVELFAAFTKAMKREKDLSTGAIAKVKTTPSRREKPFSEAEIKAILAGFHSSKTYGHYYRVVQFLFATGCRPGECFGLRSRIMSRSFNYGRSARI
jgi:integrase